MWNAFGAYKGIQNFGRKTSLEEISR